jgi:hypothetical protein
MRYILVILGVAILFVSVDSGNIHQLFLGSGAICGVIGGLTKDKELFGITVILVLLGLKDLIN